MPKVFEPFKIGTMEVPNRIVLAPTVVNMATPHPDGYVTRQLMWRYRRQARGGAGLITVEASYVREDGNNFRQMLGIHKDQCVSGLSDLVQAIKEEGVPGVKVSIQPFHGGATAWYPCTQVQPVSATARSAGYLPMPPRPLPRALSTKEVEEIVEAFALAIGRAKDAGFDTVLIHGAHGFLITQFLIPAHNQRIDRYGEDRTTIVKEIVEEARKQVGKGWPLMLRYNVDDFVKPGESHFTCEGMTVDLAIEYAKKFAAMGIAGVDLSGSLFMNWYHQIPPLYYPKAYLVSRAEKVKKAVPELVVGCPNRLGDPEVLTKVIEEGRVDFVTLCRPLIADPDLPNKLKAGKIDEIRKCMSCSECIEDLGALQQHVRCAQNPEFGREEEWEIWNRPAAVKKKVLVIGGGVGGMSAARVAAQRGHDVTLCEKTGDLGGLVNLAAATELKREIGYCVEWLKVMMKKLGVKVKLNTEVTPEFVEKFKPDAVIVATGSRQAKPVLPGIDKDIVIAEDEVLADPKKWKKIGKKVIIWGASLGCETAVELAKEGHDVTVVDRRGPEFVGRPFLIWNRWFPIVQLWMPKYGVKVVTNQVISEITDEGMVVIDERGRPKTIPADTILYSIGRRPINDLVKALEGKVPELYCIGDCVEPRKIEDAIREGANAARKL